MGVSTVRLIALDWGTSSLRAYSMGDSGSVLEARTLPLGVMVLAQLLDQSTNEDTDTIFCRAFEKACGDWLQSSPAAPIIASGMIGSSQGWHETPYLTVPISIARFDTALTKFKASAGRVIHIVPGLIENSELPNVMRGEETQVVGALSLMARECPNQPELGNEVLVGMPGTHSKWVFVRDDDIIHFETFMTGEIYAALGSHTILSRTARPAAEPDYAAFDRGVRVARSSAGNDGILSTVFSARTLVLTGVLMPEQQPDYLSGLLVGAEIASLLRPRIHETFPRIGTNRFILLVGNTALCLRYVRALAENGIENVRFVTNATEHGLWKLAVQAGLVS